MEHWFILPIFLITLSIIVKPADCYELTSDVLLHEEHLENKIDDVQNDMDLITILPILKNMEDSDTNSFLDQRISLSFSRYLFNKTLEGIKRVVQSVEKSTQMLISKITKIKEDFLKKLDETYKTVKEGVKTAIESVADKSASVVKCVMDQKSAFDSLVKESITRAMDCVKDTVEACAQTVNEALVASTEAKALLEDLSKQKSECEKEPDKKDEFLKCLSGVLSQTKASVKQVLVKIKTAVRVAFNISMQVPSKLMSCQSTIKEDALNVINNIKKCAGNSGTLLERNVDSSLESREKSMPDDYDEYDHNVFEEYEEYEEETNRN